MYNFDSLSLKNFLRINYDFLKNASAQKVQQPSRREIILNLRNNGLSQKLYININPKYPHICFINEKTSALRALKIPKSPPMFCMQLRKYIEGARIKEITIPPYERILELHFEVFDETGQLVNLTLALEIMGRHSNIILYNSRSKNILGTAHNVSPEKSSIREVYGGIPYIYPPKQQKTDILRTSFAAFCEAIKTEPLWEHYYYLSKPLVQAAINNDMPHDKIFERLQSITSLNDDSFLCKFWGGGSFNTALDNYFSDIMFNDIFLSRVNILSKLVKEEIKKAEKIALNPPDINKALEYKEKGDLIFQYICLIKDRDCEFVTPEGKIIPLDCSLNASENALKYYRLYSKAKGAYEYKSKKFDEARLKKRYYEEILFNIKNAKTYTELDETEQELYECGLIKNGVKTPCAAPVKLEKTEYSGYEIYLGKNNKQNDYLVSKFSSANDLWFHAYNCPSSHVLVKIKNGQKQPDADVLEFAARLVKQNSPMKDSGKASVIYTRRKDLKKPPGGVLGYVIYKNEKEIVV